MRKRDISPCFAAFRLVFCPIFLETGDIPDAEPFWAELLAAAHSHIQRADSVSPSGSTAFLFL